MICEGPPRQTEERNKERNKRNQHKNIQNVIQRVAAGLQIVTKIDEAPYKRNKVE